MHYFLALLFIVSSFSICSKAEAVQQTNLTIYKFASCIDGKEDSYALRPGKTIAKPIGRHATLVAQRAKLSSAQKNANANKIDSEEMLIVYFHGLNGDLSEPFRAESELSLVDTIAREYPAAAFLSCNYGKSPSWGKAVARIDITNNLRQVMKELPIKKILLIGNSMGASTALAYAATAPTYIKEKIIGVIAVCPCADLEDLYKTSTVPAVKSSLEDTFGGSPNEKVLAYHQNSLDPFLAFLSNKIKIGIICATEDTIIPIGLQRDVLRDLNNRDMNAKQFEIEGKGEPLPIKTILEAMNYICTE